MRGKKYNLIELCQYRESWKKCKNGFVFTAEKECL